MKKTLIILFFIFILTGILIFTGCKTSDQPQGEFRLTVTLGSGISGTPAAGTYYYNAGTTINYDYSLDEYYSDLVIKFDSVNVEDSGSFTVTSDHTLTGYSDPQYVIMGTWIMAEQYEDGRVFSVTVIFTGDKESGTLTDSDNGTGAYAVGDSNTVTFSLEFPTVTYEYSGIFTNVNTMSGTSKRISTTNGELTGGWSAARGANTAVLQSSPGGNKGK
jgi:hypothetical protein